MNFSDLVLVLRLSISVWGAQETDRQISNEILDSKRASRDAGRFIKNILGGKCDAIKNIQNFSVGLRAKIRSITIPQGNSSFIFPVSKVNEVVGFIKKARTEFDNLVEEFVQQYPEIIEQAKINGADLLVDKEFPTIEQVRRKFQFEFRVEPLPDSGVFSSITSLNNEMEEHLKNDYDNKVQQIFSNNEDILKARLANRISGTVKGMSEYSGKKGQLRKDSLENSALEAEIVKSLNIRENQVINNWCDRSIEVFRKPAEVYRSNVIERNWAISELNNILLEMGEELPIQVENSEEVTISDSEIDEAFSQLI